jgi:hypothetical protein
MKLKHLTIAALMVACGLLAGSCALDDREVSLALPLTGSGGTQSVGDAMGAGAASGSPSDAMVAAPRLAVGTQAIDLGWVTTGFPARARIRVDNLGNAPLAAPTVGFAEGSHADYTLIQNGCALAVAPGESCELRVQLVPSANGERAATLEVRSESGGAARVALSGLGLAAGDLILAPVAGSFEDFGGTRVGSTVEETFNIINPSAVASGPLRFRSNRPEFTLLAPGEGDCVPDDTSLLGGASCTLRLAFTPSERGPLEATLTGASDGAGAVSITLLGRGLLPAALSASAPAVDFAGVVLGSSAQRNVSFENSGDEPLTLAGARLVPEDADGFSILSSDCGEGAQLEGGASCSVQVAFRPPQVGEERTAELVAQGVETEQTAVVALRGVGLEQGALTVSAPAQGDDDFGEVLLGASSERRFQIQNPSPQPSGVLDFAVSEGFALAEPTDVAAGECVAGSTSLVNGESCSVRVLFAPARRELFTGSLTVSSPLAGASELPLQGRGILPAMLAVVPELNFGRVLTGASGVRTLTVENDGDQPLPPPSLELTGSSPAQVAAFSFVSQCSAPLAFGETCNVDLTFAPSEATAHAVTLSVGSAGGDTGVLLLGEAQAPGSLVLSAEGGAAAFGDVPIGTSATRSFALENPGQIASGLLAISSDNNRFEIDLGNCNQGDPAGLVDGASCTFSVRFTPADNLPQVANLSVQSPGAGRAGLQISGRGRQPASLLATGNRDLGRANVGQDAIREPQNEFTWTVNNQGDLPTGTLTLQNDNGTEFAIRNDSCSGSAVPGRASCQMIIRFRPSAAGNRSARVVVTDPSGPRSATLALTGLGVQLAGLGQSCVNAECAAGECTRGVCCDRACDRTCQVCSAQGQCIDQSSQEACGNGAACFGVDNCKLPAGRACSQNGGDAQCGSANCERRLGGTGPGDRICCLDDCGTGLECNTSNRCQAPALGAGEPCGAAGQLACGAGLECKECRGGGRRCTAPSECCGGCPAGSTCLNGTRCSECTTGQRRCNNGRPQQCSGGLWQDSTPCPGNLSCINDGQCGCTGNTPRQCGVDVCVALTQCCQDSDCTNGCQACNTTSHSCGPLGGRPDRCPGGQACNATGQCGGAGATCLTNNDCSGGLCASWALSGDGDAFGRQNTLVRTCGATAPQVPSSAGPTDVYVRVTDGIPDIQRFDCCDTDMEARPGQTTFFQRARTGCSTGELAFDFNCDGSTEPNPPLGPCTAFGIANCPAVISSEINCGGAAAGAACVAIDAQLVRCTSGADCACQGVRGAQSTQTCR